MPDITQIQVGSTTYDIRDTNIALKAPVILNSASGSIASFTDGSASPVTALSVSIDPVQDLHGYDNPWPAGGGKNLWNGSNGYWAAATGIWTESGAALNYQSSQKIKVSEGDVFYIVADKGISTQYVISWLNGNFVSGTQVSFNSLRPYTVPSGVDEIAFDLNFSSQATALEAKVMMNRGNTAEPYSPYSNICPISGHSTATVTRTGKNVLEPPSSGATIKGVTFTVNTDGTITANGGTSTGDADFYFVGAQGVYEYANISTGNYIVTGNSGFTNETTIYIVRKTGSQIICSQNADIPVSVSLDENEQYRIFIRVHNQKTVTNQKYYPMIRSASISDDTFESYQKQQVTIDLDGTRYGGVLNVLTGEMTVDRKYISFTGGWNIAGNGVLYMDNSATDGVASKNHFICNMYPFGTIAGGTATALEFPKTICLQSLNGIRFMIYDAIYTTAQQFNDFLANNPLQVVYPLATPLTVQLTPSQLAMLEGTNVLWSDTGDVAVTYRADTKLFIEEHSKAKRPFYVKGTQTSSTGSWTGNLPDIDSLYEGLIIDYWLPYAGSGNATLNLTLKGGVTSGAINIYYGGTTRLTTHLPALYVGQFIYQTVTINGTNYTGWWYLRSYDSGNTTDIVNLYQGSGAYQANSTVYRYQLLFQMDENKLTPLNNNSNTTGTTKTMLTDVEFDPFGYIFYYNSTTTINANGNMTTTLYYQRNEVDLRYTFNCGQTLTAHKMLYLKLSLQSNGKVKIANATPWTHDLPTTNDGYLYLLLGRTYSTYQFALFKEHPIYYHNGTDLIEYTKFSKPTTSIPGLMLEAPSDDNEYMRKNGEWTKPLLGNLAFMNSNNGIEIFMITK